MLQDILLAASNNNGAGSLIMPNNWDRWDSYLPGGTSSSVGGNQQLAIDSNINTYTDVFSCSGYQAYLGSVYSFNPYLVGKKIRFVFDTVSFKSGTGPRPVTFIVGYIDRTGNNKTTLLEQTIVRYANNTYWEHDLEFLVSDEAARVFVGVKTSDSYWVGCRIREISAS